MCRKRNIVLGLCAAFVLPFCARTEEGLVARYDFGEGSGTTLADKSGNGYDGKIVGGQWMKGKENFDTMISHDFLLF